MAFPRNPLEGALFDLSSRTKLRITGNDRERYLNGQITNDLRKATDSCAIEACILNAKGKTDAHVFISQDGESYLLDAAPELREKLAPRLERYIISDDVQVADVTDELSILHVIGPPPDLPDGKRITSKRFGVAGHDLWIARSQLSKVLDRLTKSVPFLDQEELEVFRIEQGIPRWGRELTPEIIPVEANLEANSIDYEKGCYIGQEVISRMKMSGQRNKALCGFIAADESALSEGQKLLSAEGKEIGWITSTAQSKRLGRAIALGYIKRGATPPPGVTIVDLPFPATCG